MKKVYRYEDNKDYWDRRWAEAGIDNDRFKNLDIYPIHFAEMVMNNRKNRVIELGAGSGRLLKHYHHEDFNIVGIERSEVAVKNLKLKNPEIDIKNADILNLPFEDDAFDVVLAFGLYHNLETESDLEKALGETARCLRNDGEFSISIRPNNLEMNLNEWYWNWKRKRKVKPKKTTRKFHKLLIGPDEFRLILEKHGLIPEKILKARNVSILYRLPFLREHGRKEAQSRSVGYRLNWLGRRIDWLLTSLFPYQFCNVLVYLGHMQK